MITAPPDVVVAGIEPFEDENVNRRPCTWVRSVGSRFTTSPGIVVSVPVCQVPPSSRQSTRTRSAPVGGVNVEMSVSARYWKESGAPSAGSWMTRESTGPLEALLPPIVQLTGSPGTAVTGVPLGASTSLETVATRFC